MKYNNNSASVLNLKVGNVNKNPLMYFLLTKACHCSQISFGTVDEILLEKGMQCAYHYENSSFETKNSLSIVSYSMSQNLITKYPYSEYRTAETS